MLDVKVGFVNNNDVDIAVITVPKNKVDEVIDILSNTSVRGI